MRPGSLTTDLVMIMESLYKGRMTAIRVAEFESGSQNQITADGTHACTALHCTHSVQREMDQQKDAYCSGLVSHAVQSLVYKRRRK